MNKTMRDKWVQRIQDLEAEVSELKAEAQRDTYQPVGCHPIVHGLAAIEGLTWGLDDAIRRFPTEETIENDQQLELLQPDRFHMRLLRAPLA